MFKVEEQENYLALSFGGDITSLANYELLDGVLTITNEEETQIEKAILLAQEAKKNILVVDALYEERTPFYESQNTVAVPTLTEATDYIYMQQLERELGE